MPNKLVMVNEKSMWEFLFYSWVATMIAVVTENEIPGIKYYIFSANVITDLRRNSVLFMGSNHDCGRNRK